MARSRSKRDTKPPEIPVFCEGQSERHYVLDVKRVLGLKIRIKPDIISGNPVGIIKTAKNAEQYFDFAFCLYDMDQVRSQNLWSEYREAIKDFPENITLCPSHPCFELFLILHFIEYNRPQVHCDELEKQLRNHVPDYEKGQTIFTEKILRSGSDEIIKKAQKCQGSSQRLM